MTMKWVRSNNKALLSKRHFNNLIEVLRAPITPKERELSLWNSRKNVWNKMMMESWARVALFKRNQRHLAKNPIRDPDVIEKDSCLFNVLATQTL